MEETPHAHYKQNKVRVALLTWEKTDFRRGIINRDRDYKVAEVSTPKN